MPRFTSDHRHRQSGTRYSYSADYAVNGRDVSWQAQVLRGGRRFSLCGGGIELPDEHRETGLGMSAQEIVRLDVNRSIDGMEE
jgi:hypothetical protein